MLQHKRSQGHEQPSTWDYDAPNRSRTNDRNTIRSTLKPAMLDDVVLGVARRMNFLVARWRGGRRGGVKRERLAAKDARYSRQICNDERGVGL